MRSNLSPGRLAHARQLTSVAWRRRDHRGRRESESAGISSFCVLQSDYSSDECVRLAASRHG